MSQIIVSSVEVPVVQIVEVIRVVIVEVIQVVIIFCTGLWGRA